MNAKEAQYDKACAFPTNKHLRHVKR